MIADVSGGYHPSIFDAIRTAVHVSNTHAIFNSPDYQPINVKEAFRLATLGGSKGTLQYFFGNKAFFPLPESTTKH